MALQEESTKKVFSWEWLCLTLFSGPEPSRSGQRYETGGGLTTDRAFTARICCVHKRPRIEVRIQTLHKHWASSLGVWSIVFVWMLCSVRINYLAYISNPVTFVPSWQSMNLPLSYNKSPERLNQACLQSTYHTDQQSMLSARCHSHCSWHSA